CVKGYYYDNGYLMRFDVW
nr:immunoglobulin heavy chain junction region [Macaca mulatta]